MHPPVYVINLERSKGRLTRITQVLAAAGICFERIVAVDGAEPDALCAVGGAVYDAERSRKEYLAPLSQTEIACMFSHRKAWAHFLRTTEAPAAVFLEDDAELLAGAGDLTAFVGTFADPQVPVLCKLNLPGRSRNARRSQRAGKRLIAPLTNVAQLLNRAAAQALLDFTSVFHEPADVALQRWWDHRVRIRVAQPPFFRETRGHGCASTIRPPDARPPEGRLLREMRRPLFQTRRLVRAWTAQILTGQP